MSGNEFIFLNCELLYGARMRAVARWRSESLGLRNAQRLGNGLPRGALIGRYFRARVK